MKHTRLIFLLSSLLIILTVPLLSMSKSESRNFVLSTLKKYAPEGYGIINSYGRMPTAFKFGASHIRISKTDFMVYADANSILSLITSMGTMVHETCHGYQSRRGYQIIPKDEIKSSSDSSYLTIYVGNGKDILIKQTPVFRTQKMAKSIPLSVRTFRYSYVNSSEKYLGAQKDGVYGLLDELSAYYHGTLTSYLLMKNSLKIFGNKKVNWSKMLSMSLGSYYAHREFKHYILAYLLYAKKHYPSIYSGIMSNRPFQKAFLTIDRKFKILIKDIFSLSFLKGTPYKVIRETNMIGIALPSAMNTSYVSSFEDSYKKLGEEMKKEAYVDLLDEMRENMKEF